MCLLKIIFCWFTDPKQPFISAGLRNVSDEDNEIKQELYFKCTSEEIKSGSQFDFFQFIWSVDGNVSFTSEIVEKGNLSNGYFYEKNGITRLGIKVIIYDLKKILVSVAKVYKNHKIKQKI